MKRTNNIKKLHGWKKHIMWIHNAKGWVAITIKTINCLAPLGFCLMQEWSIFSSVNCSLVLEFWV